MKKVVTVCPYCASGCKINLVVDNGKIVRAEAAQGKTNQGTLCLKGYYGWDFINDTQILTPRLKTPMIRRTRGGKLESVSWDEALDRIADLMKADRDANFIEKNAQGETVNRWLTTGFLAASAASNATPA